MKLSLLFIFLLCSFFATAQIVDIPDANFKNALLNHVPVIDTNNDGEIQVSEAEAVDGSLRVQESGIDDLTGIEAFVNLFSLDCSSNNLTSVDISSNTSLLGVKLNQNSLSDIDVSMIGALSTLSLSDNSINSLDVSQNLELKSIDISANPIANLDITNNTDLELFSCNDTNINFIDVSQNPNLFFLRVSETPMSNIDLSNNTNLEQFSCFETNISTLDFSQNINLKLVTIDNTLITEIDLTNNPNLESFTCAFTNISSLDVSQNGALEILNIANTPLTEIDLSNSQNLTRIFSSSTNITTLDFSNNPELIVSSLDSNFNLEYVNLNNNNNNNITFLSALNNPNLQFICVDDVAFASENFTDVPPLTTFVEDCSIANNDLNNIEGILTYDNEGDGCDTNDLDVSGLFVNTTDGTNNFATSSINDGLYRLTVTENTYTTSVLGLPSYFTVSPNEAVDSFIGFNQTETADFCITPNTTANDLAVTFVPLVDARPGFDTSYQLVYENLGATTLSGSVVLNFDNGRVTFLEAMPTASSQTASTLTWDFTDLGVFEKAIINVDFNVLPPPTNESGDTLAFTATANPVTGDATPEDNEFTLNQIVVNSLDPNDKKVLEGSQRLIAEAAQALHYVVRFQNMGTASAINVRVQDVLDEQLDWTTLRVLDASHAMETTLVNGQIDFIFDDINLPNEATDPEGSNGYVSYSIKPLPGIAVGDMIENTADIYFDFNAAITTNTVNTQYVTELSIPDVVANDIVLYPNPTSDFITIKAATEILSISVFNVLGQKVNVPVTLSSESSTDLSSLQNGVYFVSILVSEGSEVFQVIKE